MHSVGGMSRRRAAIINLSFGARHEQRPESEERPEEKTGKDTEGKARRESRKEKEVMQTLVSRC
jgi:hypothetical protein